MPNPTPQELNPPSTPPQTEISTHPLPNPPKMDLPPSPPPSSSSSSAAASEAAHTAKALGNQCYHSGHYPEALTHYSHAIQLDPTHLSAYLNRALMHLKLECPGAALSDAEAALALDYTSAKAHYRKGYAHYLLGHYKSALPAFAAAVRIETQEENKNKDNKNKDNINKNKMNKNKNMNRNKEASQMYDLCEKELARANFLKAIALPERARPYEVVQWQGIEIGEGTTDYTGPRWEQDEPIPSKTFLHQMMEGFSLGRLLHKRYAIRILLEARKLFAACENIHRVDRPVGEHITVCGDIHGQYFDLANLFTLNGFPEGVSNPYLFNGDLVDRGSYGVECLLTLCAVKLHDPAAVFLSRGNHEGLNLNKVYGFEGEAKAKYGEGFYELAHDVFRALPLGHVLGTKVFITHGGLFAQDGVTVEGLNQLNRCRDIPEEGLMCEMLWSDPQEGEGRAPNKRGVGVAFGPDVTDSFLKHNGFDLLIRSHEVKPEGYVVEHGGKCVTVFSAPNYCDQLGNKGAFIRMTRSEKRRGEKTGAEEGEEEGTEYWIPAFTSFTHVPHPGVKAMQYSPYMI